MPNVSAPGGGFAPSLATPIVDLPPPTPSQGQNSGSVTQDTPPTDWSTLLGIYGMPPDVAARVGQIFAQYPDPAQASIIALAYIRGTPWYAQTYPGIQYGMRNGLFTNEAGYRQYVNAIDQYYTQYLGRKPTADEITSFLQNGSDPSLVGKTLEGNAYANAYKSDIEYYAGNFGSGQLSQAELQAYGQEKVGLGSSSGYKIQKMIDDAVARFKGAFGGTLAKPDVSLGPVGLAAPSLGGATQALTQAGSDVGAA